MSEQLFHSSYRTPQPDPVLEVTRADVGWDSIDFAVRSIAEGDAWTSSTEGMEACLVLLAGACQIRWGGEIYELGPRVDVFSSYPGAAYLPPGTDFEITAVAPTELADGRVVARKGGTARLITPSECGLEIRGGGTATRQIIDIVPPDFPAERILVCEVLTPSGSWSSYPPHKHDVQNPPDEVDLDEIYYYRFQTPEAYGLQRLYTADGTLDEAYVVRHGDLLPIRHGYHPFVAAHGYNAYYLNVLAGNSGSVRSMAASDDPAYVHLRDWPPPDPRLPLIPHPDRSA